VKQAIPSSAGPSGEVWFATTVKGGRVFSYVFVSDLPEDWDMVPSDIALKDDLTYRAFESASPSNVFLFSKDSPLRLKVVPSSLLSIPLFFVHSVPISPALSVSPSLLTSLCLSLSALPRIVTKMSSLCGQLFQSRRVESLCLVKWINGSLSLRPDSEC
jgi:hypothetical protein